MEEKKEKINQMKQSQQEFLKKQKIARDKDLGEKKKFIQHHQQIRRKWETERREKDIVLAEIKQTWEAERNKVLSESLDKEIVLAEALMEQDKV